MDRKQADARRNAEHVVFNGTDVCCNICSEKRSLELPTSAKTVVIILRSFVNRHADCVQKNKPNAKILPYLFYITRQEFDNPKRIVLLNYGGFNTKAEAEAQIWNEIEPGVKEYRPGMAGHKVINGAVLLTHPSRMQIEGEK